VGSADLITGAYPSAAALADGGFVVAFVVPPTQFDRNKCDVYGQRYSAKGKRVGNEFLVNTNHKIVMGKSPSIAGLLNGGFVITWTGAHVGEGYDVYASATRRDG
jgi:hypothetical protein